VPVNEKLLVEEADLLTLSVLLNESETLVEAVEEAVGVRDTLCEKLVEID
jgi:hypothetical protein